MSSFEPIFRHEITNGRFTKRIAVIETGDFIRPFKLSETLEENGIPVAKPLWYTLTEKQLEQVKTICGLQPELYA